MPNPIRVEERFQEIYSELESDPSTRYVYALVEEFIRGLEGEYRRYATYIVQLSGKLQRYHSPLTWSGLNPSLLESQITLFEYVAVQLDGQQGAGLAAFSQHLKAVCLLLYGCLEDLTAAERHFHQLTGRPLAVKESPERQTALLEQMNLQLQESGISTPELRWLRKQLPEILNKQKQCLLIPVAEVYGGSYPHSFGRLRCIQVELHGQSQTEEDELAREYRFIGAEEPVQDSDNEALRAARRLFSARHPGIKLPPCRGSARYELSGALHDGRSSDLAVGGLWYTRLEEEAQRRTRYVLNPHAAVTGRLNPEGKVGPVGEETICLKAEAAFFSWAEVLVMPENQKRLFEQHLQSLRESYPHRNLLLLEAKNLEDLFFDRRLAQQLAVGRVEHAIRRIGEYRFRAFGIPLVMILVAIIIWLIYGPIDQNPVDYRYGGNSWVLENQFGQEVKRIPLSDLTTSRFGFEGPQLNLPIIQLLDVNGDGINEVVYGENASGHQTDYEVSMVKAYSVSGDSIIWERSLVQNYDFPRQSGVTQREMIVREIQTIDTDDGTKLVMNANSFYYFPAVVFLMDPATGEVESEYLHIGHFRDMLVVDHNGDGREEVVLLGISNAFWMASLAILDPETMHGYSPLNRDYKPEGLERADELAYLLFPKTVVGTYTDPIMKYNEGMVLYYDLPSRTIRAQVEEGRIFFRNEVGSVILEITFDRDYEPAGVGTSDVYDIVARDLYENGEIPFEPDFDYFEAYQDSILYWAGGEFVTAEEYFKSNH